MQQQIIDTNLLRRHLIRTAQKKSLTDYHLLATELGLKAPQIGQKLLRLLAACQEDDALLERPQLAALVVEKGGARVPKPEFFQKLTELTLYTGKTRGPEAQMWHQNELEKVYRHYGQLTYKTE